MVGNSSCEAIAVSVSMGVEDPSETQSEFVSVVNLCSEVSLLSNSDISNSCEVSVISLCISSG